jgi:hypothetical protein
MSGDSEDGGGWAVSAGRDVDDDGPLMDLAGGMEGMSELAIFSIEDGEIVSPSVDDSPPRSFPISFKSR